MTELRDYLVRLARSLALGHVTMATTPETQILAIVQNIQNQLTKVLANLATIQSEQHPNVINQILTTVTTILNKESKMADILDTVLADVQQEVTDMQALSAQITAIITDLQQIQSGAISTNDPRFQTAISNLQAVDAAIQQGTSNIMGALPKPPTP